MSKPLSDDTIRFLQYSPYFALLEGKTKEQTTDLNEKYDALPETSRQFLLSPEAADGIGALVESGTVPASHAAAVSKLLGMVVMGDVQSDQVSPLLTKLGIPAQSAGVIAQQFNEILKPVTAARIARIAAQQGMRPIQPLTQRIGIPVPPPPPPAPQNASRNVVDLRNRPQS